MDWKIQWHEGSLDDVISLFDNPVDEIEGMNTKFNVEKSIVIWVS